MNIPSEAHDIVWWLIGISAIFTIVGGLMALSSDTEAKQAGINLLIGWWSGVTTVVAATLAMTFVIKPMLASVFSLF